MLHLHNSGILLAPILIVMLVLAGCTAWQNTAMNPATVPAAGTVLTPAGPPARLPAYSPADVPDANRIALSFRNIPGGTLDPAELKDIDYLEKLQKLDADLYAAMAAEYPGTRVFSDLALVSGALESVDDVVYTRYNITDPESGTPGVFNDANFQRLYGDEVLKMKGNTGSAFMTAAQNEDRNIVDFMRAMSRTDNPDLTYMYSLELAGARNNLRAITAQLTTMGTPYTPIYLPADTYTAIIGSDMEPFPVR